MQDITDIVIEYAIEIIIGSYNPVIGSHTVMRSLNNLVVSKRYNYIRTMQVIFGSDNHFEIRTMADETARLKMFVHTTRGKRYDMIWIDDLAMEYYDKIISFTIDDESDKDVITDEGVTMGIDILDELTRDCPIVTNRAYRPTISVDIDDYIVRILCLLSDAIDVADVASNFPDDCSYQINSSDEEF